MYQTRYYAGVSINSRHHPAVPAIDSTSRCTAKTTYVLGLHV